MCEWRAVPTLAVRSPRALALRIRRLYSEVWWRLLSVAVRNFCLSCFKGWVKACMHSLSSSGMVHQGWRSVVESGPVANRMGGVGGILAFGLSANGNGEFLVFGDAVPVGNDSFGSGIRQVVASDVCVSTDFV